MPSKSIYKPRIILAGDSIHNCFLFSVNVEATTPVLTGVVTKKVLAMYTSVSVHSPTRTDGAHLIETGFARFIRMPLSLDLSRELSNPMLVKMDHLPFCTALRLNQYVGVLPLNEDAYYDHFAKVSLKGIQESTMTSGKKQAAKTLFPEAFSMKKSRCPVTLPDNCQPELATRVKAPQLPSFNGEMKSISDTAMEELVMYTTIGICDSYFSGDVGEGNYAFYPSPPIGCSVLGQGPVGMLFAVELIGVVFYSLLSEPFFAGTDKHKEAVAMFDRLAEREGADISDQRPFYIPKEAEFLQPRDPTKEGVFWGRVGHRFVKVIQANHLVKRGKAKDSTEETCFAKVNPEYINIINEDSCLEAAWTGNAIFFFHLHKVMTLWKEIWRGEAVGEDAVCRAVFLPMDLLYGEFQVCLISEYVGDSDASIEEFSDSSLMKPVVTAILWLARVWGLLYIDIRPQNMRVTATDGGKTIRVIDYDDVVILSRPSCCNRNTECLLKRNCHGAKILKNFPHLASLFSEAASDVCDACAADSST